MDIIHRPLFYLKHNLSENGFGFRLQVEYIQLGLIDRASLSPDTSNNTSNAYETKIYGCETMEY
jgi:hypothetical protein